MEARIPHPVVDADTHVVEPDSVWSSYLDPEYRTLARSVFWRSEGPVGPFIVLNGRQVDDMWSSRIPREGIWRPGMTEEEIGSLDPRGSHTINPGAYDPTAKLLDMDAMGVDTSVVFPTYFLEYLPLVENPDVAAALARAYNDWIADFVRAAPDRLVPVAVLPVQNVNFAIEEVRRVVGKGFGSVVLRPVFVGDRYLNHPYYDPLWQELAERQITVAIHPATGSSNPEWTCHAPFIERVHQKFGTGHPVASAVAPMMDNSIALLQLLAFSHLVRFEGIKVIFCHSSGTWLPIVLEKSETYLTIAAVATDIPVRPDSDKVFFEKGAMIGVVASELPLHRMYDYYEDIGVWGSHYPQHDTMSPTQAFDKLGSGGVPDSIIKRLMLENAQATYKIKSAAHSK